VARLYLVMSRASRGTEPTGDMNWRNMGFRRRMLSRSRTARRMLSRSIRTARSKKMVATIVGSVSAAKKHVSKMSAVTSKLSKKEDWPRWLEGVSMALSQHGLVWLLSASDPEERKLLFSKWMSGRLEYFGGDVGVEIDWDRGGTTFLRHIKELSDAEANLDLFESR
jgi:hypothetical protein